MKKIKIVALIFILIYLCSCNVISDNSTIDENQLGIDVATSNKELTCTFSVRCDTVLANMEDLDFEKKELNSEE